MEDTIYGVTYTYDVWKKIYPELADKRIWENYNGPNNIIELVMNDIRNRVIDHTKVKFIVMDEEFVNYGGCETEYWHSRTPEECLRLLQKNNLQYVYQVLYLPVDGEDFIPYMLPDQIKNVLYEALCKKYSETDIFLPGFVLDGRTALLSEKILISMAKKYYKEGENCKIPLISRNEDECEDVAYIPFVIRKELTKAVFTISEVLEYSKVFFVPSNLNDYSKENSLFYGTRFEMISGNEIFNCITVIDLIVNAVYLEGVFTAPNKELLIYQREAALCQVEHELEMPISLQTED